jgi:hypothetical protein
LLFLLSPQEQAKRHRPLARASQQQLLGDLAALLCGLRAVVMLDYATGTNVQQLVQLLAPMQQQQPSLARELLQSMAWPE